MESLFAITLRMQRAALESYLSATRTMTGYGLRMLERQQRLLLRTWTPIRDEDGAGKAKGRKAHECGARLADRYGKRHLDVDVEHI